MHLRQSKQRGKNGSVRSYYQIVESFRRDDGVPAHKVIAHLGVLPDLVANNLRAALAAARRNNEVIEAKPAPDDSKDLTRVSVVTNLAYLPLAVVDHEFRRFGLYTILNELCGRENFKASAADVLSALVAQRCVAPDSKLAFQRWLNTTALPSILGVKRARLNDTRVHRVMDELAEVDAELQTAVEQRVVAAKQPRTLFLDLTDTWFEGRQVSLSSRGTTKAGHRSKRKIHIALLVNEQGLPMRWKLLPGALSETTVLPDWIPWLHTRPALNRSVLIFDRGLPCAANFRKLLDPETGHLFLTSVKSDVIPGLVEFDYAKLDALQNLPAEASKTAVGQACKDLGLSRHDETTYTRDLGLVQSSRTNARRSDPLPPMRGYVSFNREIQLTKRERRDEKIKKLNDFVNNLNNELRGTRRARNAAATRKKVDRELDRLSLSECFRLELRDIQIAGRGKAKKPISSFEVKLEERSDMLRNMARFDGISVLVGHPTLEYSVAEAVAAYRAKAVVESDFRTIKSVLKLRPVFHHTDDKVQSHVTICVLALLVERLLEQRLQKSRRANLPRTASAALAELAQVRQTEVRIDGVRYQRLSEATPEQSKILSALDATKLLQI